ncbi:MAG: 1-(5-phosphoribosyl)-5-[(5-phosphoribosylamino)methylideneamino]imidazole-4-carboxamide isomerase [Rhodospirillaceae bacterium]|jgi:phosphoribosylformimino-5-aminoimidazole carboxamide ribotide isomerase|nr:1-(5-phosphoribosyl)-5-[(5-phosphoribosylamino)methylideneamino]imidazole-4-carboxamide isomerase [Rhodospirillaceae bacterium]
MILYPAIDLKDNICVRLKQGKMDAITIFNTDPADQTKKFIMAGCEWIHVVDLNGAFTGHPVNADSIAMIIATSTVPVQLGGGIRDMKTIAMWIEKGVSRVVLGTVSLHNSSLVKEACAQFPGQVAISIDARDGYVAVEGWSKNSEITALDLALKFEDAGVATIIYTDINHDGLLCGLNILATVALAERLTTPIIAAGGVASLDDLYAIKEYATSGIDGVISGRAIYDGRIDLIKALMILKD